MKQLLVITLLSGIVALSCNNSAADKNATATTDDRSTATPASTTTTSGKGNITCTIDGTPYSHEATAGFMKINAETKMPVDPNDKTAKIMLSLREQHEGFVFDIININGANKIGKSHKTNMGYTNKSGVMYAMQTGEIDVISFDGNHLVGTFSGEFTKVNGEKGFPDNLKLENGKFDLNKN